MDRERAQRARQEADDAIRGVQELTLAAAPDEAMRATDHPTEWCPAPIPCIGRPAYVVIVPVRVVNAGAGPHALGEKIGDLEATYCPACRALASRTRQPAA